MSEFRHILVLFFMFSTHQSVKSESSTDRTILEHPIPTAHDSAAFNFTRDTGFFTLEISMKNDKCVNDIAKTKALRDAEETIQPLGVTKENPAESCNDLDENGDYYIKSNMSDQSFKVRCNVENKTTCLLVNGEKEESSINSSAITLTNQIWLSQTDFDVHSLYNKVEGITGTNRAQISYLLSTSTSVNQKIKYYYGILSNGTFIKTKDNKVGSLKALLWNDHLVGSQITKHLPMQFKTESCSSGSDWMCSFIIFKDNSNMRLPVTDFYIEDVRAKSTSADETTPTQKIYFDLVELCFNYD